MNALQVALFTLAAVVMALLIWVIFNHREACERIKKRFMRKIGFCIVFMYIVSTCTAQDDPPIVDPDGVPPVEQPIILDMPVMQEASNSLLAWAEQGAWSGPTWINMTVNLTGNVTA